MRQIQIFFLSKYEWTPPQNINCNDAACSAPTITVKNNICYTVKATNIYGCSGGDTICISTFCKNSQVFIPNAFTPNGLAENSKFMVRASGIASIKSFRVFNRWGRVVFERNNFAPNDPAYGWDGMINGKPADMGVYVYTVEVVCENGTPYFYKGNVTLFNNDDEKHFKIYVYAAVCCCSIKSIHAQDIGFSQFYEQPLLRNPALAGIFNGDVRLTASYRNQWQSVTVPYRTLALSTEIKFPMQVMNA